MAWYYELLRYLHKQKSLSSSPVLWRTRAYGYVKIVCMGIVAMSPSPKRFQLMYMINVIYLKV